MSTNQGRANAGSQSTQNLARLFRLTNGWTAGNNRFAIDTTDNTKYTKLKTFRELTTSLPTTPAMEDIFTIEPLFCFIIVTIQAFAILK